MVLGEHDQAWLWPELALTRLQLAEFREMKMQPSLEHALRHREVLEA